jgi:inosose dehydratase
MDIRRLEICNQWFSSFLASQPYKQVEKDFRAQLGFLKAMGADVIGPSEQTSSCQGDLHTSVFTGKAVFSTEEFRALTEGMNKLGHIAREEGMTLAFHHHMGTAVQTIEETERFLNDTDPDKVTLVFDSGRFAFSGEDPVAALEKFISRVGHVHLKDMRTNVFNEVKTKDSSFMDAVREGVFTVPGDGSIDFPSLFTILDKNNYKGWMVVEAEQDPAKANAFTYAKMARDYIRINAGI